MQHGSGSKTYTKRYGLRSEQKRTFFSNKKAKRARKDLTFPGGNETIRSNDEGRNLKKNVSLKNGDGSVHLVLTQQIKETTIILFLTSNKIDWQLGENVLKEVDLIK